MLERLRADPGANGLVTGNGYYLTKHALSVFGTRPPETPFRYLDTQPEVDRLPWVSVRADYCGPARCETYTVMHTGDGIPEYAVAACRDPDGKRVWAKGTAPALLRALLDGDPLGMPMEVAGTELRLA